MALSRQNQHRSKLIPIVIDSTPLPDTLETIDALQFNEGYQDGVHQFGSLFRKTEFHNYDLGAERIIITARRGPIGHPRRIITLLLAHELFNLNIMLKAYGNLQYSFDIAAGALGAVEEMVKESIKKAGRTGWPDAFEYWIRIIDQAVKLGKLSAPPEAADIGFGLAVTYQEANQVLCFSAGDCGVFCGWHADEGFAVSTVGGEAFLSVDTHTPREYNFLLAPIGFLASTEDEGRLERKTESVNIKTFISPHRRKFDTENDFAILTSYALPREQADIMIFLKRLNREKPQSFPERLCELHEPIIEDCMAMMLVHT